MFVSSSILRSRVHKSNAGLFSLSIAFYLPPQIYSSLARRPRLHYVALGKKKQSLMDLLFPSPFLWRIYVRIWASSAGVLECNINCVHYRETQSPASAKKKQTRANAVRKMLFTFNEEREKKKTACREKRKEEGGEACGRPGRWVQS